MNLDNIIRDSNIKSDNILNVVNLKKYFPTKKGVFGLRKEYIKAVDDVSFYIKSGETLGLVGESGCGKSTVGHSILRLIEPTEGKIVFDGQEITNINGKNLRKLRNKFQIIFQDPLSSLDPRFTIGRSLSEPFEIQKIYKRKEINEKVKELVEIVGLSQDSIGRYPHEFSGGQKQRICIARALAVSPKMIVCDECVSALDVSIQAQIINLLVQLKNRKNSLSYLFISHDLRVIKHISDRVAVMYLGKIVEIAEKTDLFNNPKHPYTQSLLSAIPFTDPSKKREKILLTDDILSLANMTNGCKFNNRCFKVQKICKETEPEIKQYGNNHYCSCHFCD